MAEQPGRAAAGRFPRGVATPQKQRVNFRHFIAVSVIVNNDYPPAPEGLFVEFRSPPIAIFWKGKPPGAERLRIVKGRRSWDCPFW
jgi:hypothetical protein